MLAEETGEYEFCLKADNGARLWVNDMQKPLIDAWVKSGDELDHVASIRLLGGRVYPIRLDYSKFQSKSATVALHWQPPHRVRGVIPPRNLSPNWFPPVLVVNTPFPADDSSVGYERGTSVSAAWDQATTEAALEIAGQGRGQPVRVGQLQGRRSGPGPAVKEFCYRFVERAFRRPLTDEQKQFFVDRRFEGSGGTGNRGQEGGVADTQVAAFPVPGTGQRSAGRLRGGLAAVLRALGLAARSVAAASRGARPAAHAGAGRGSGRTDAGQSANPVESPLLLLQVAARRAGLRRFQGPAVVSRASTARWRPTRSRPWTCSWTT